MGGVGLGWRDNGRRAVRSSAGFSKMGSRLSSTSGRPVDQPFSRLPDEEALLPLAGCGSPSPACGSRCRAAPDEGGERSDLLLIFSIFDDSNVKSFRALTARATFIYLCKQTLHKKTKPT